MQRDWSFVVDESENLLRGLVRDVVDHSEPAREGRDEECGIDCEWAFEDVEAHGAGVGDNELRGRSGSRVGSGCVGKYLLLEPGEDAVVCWVGCAVQPVVFGRAAVGLVEVELGSDVCDVGGDVSAAFGGKGTAVQIGVMVHGE